MEDRFLLSIKRLNIDINYIRKSLLCLNPDIITRNKIKDINDYNDLRLFMEFYKLTGAQSSHKFLIGQLIILTLIKTSDHSTLKKINFMIRNKYLNKNLSDKMHDLFNYVISDKYNIDINRMSKLYFELEDYYFENEYRRLELLKY
jgi:hypothetical protein